MCGIAGIVNFKAKSVNSPELKLMMDKIAHRGPDDEGMYISPDRKIGLGSRRLAIIDLSQKGHQPMSYVGRYWVVTNGEIYNFKDEKRKLERLGYKFDSDCDTEVILALYDKYREKCLDHLRGMFAFCIYDSKEQTLFLARDRVGVKPLKYAWTNDSFIFASEIKAILTRPEIKRVPDYIALQMYMLYGYIPAPATGFVGINKLEPGHHLTINLKRKSVINKKYWEPLFKEKLQLTEKQWCQNILDTLEESTKLRMISDVPIGAYLSGGVDSSAVVALMALSSKKPINTFTITFKDKKWDESKYAKAIAERYHTNHTELMASEADFDMLPELSYIYEEPYADAGCVVNYMVNSLAKKYVTVVLNGDGGDENFAGYPNRHMRLKRDVDYYDWVKIARPLALSGLNSLAKLSTKGALGRAAKFLEKSKLPLYERFTSYNQIFGSDEIARIARGKLSKFSYSPEIYEPARACFEHFTGSDLKDAGLKFDLKYWLPDDLLAKADLMSMANSIEARSPFLDYKMIELTGKMPFDLKVKNGESKYILKKALEKIVPKENLYRMKRGFGVPLHLWFKGKLNSYTKGVLLDKKAITRDIIDPRMTKEMLENHSDKNDYGPRLWSLLTLELWFKAYFQ